MRIPVPSDTFPRVHVCVCVSIDIAAVLPPQNSDASQRGRQRTLVAAVVRWSLHIFVILWVVYGLEARAKKRNVARVFSKKSLSGFGLRCCTRIFCPGSWAGVHFCARFCMQVDRVVFRQAVSIGGVAIVDSGSLLQSRYNFLDLCAVPMICSALESVRGSFSCFA